MCVISIRTLFSLQLYRKLSLFTYLSCTMTTSASDVIIFVVANNDDNTSR